MDSYKKFILLGAFTLIGGYFLPWIADNGQTLTGWNLVRLGYEYLRFLLDMEPFQWARVEASQVVFYSAIALPALGAVLAAFYCLLRPTGQGGFGTLLFLLPALVIITVHGYVLAARGSSSMAGTIAANIASTVSTSAFDLTRTGGLWTVHLGALLMLLARLARGGPRP